MYLSSIHHVWTGGVSLLTCAYLQLALILVFVVPTWSQDTRVDREFAVGAGPSAPIYAVAETADGKVLVGGMFDTVNGMTRHYVARLLRNGAVDQLFNPQIGPNNLVDAIVPSPDGTIMIGGYFTHYNGMPANHLVQVASDGNINGIFDITSGPDFWVYTIVPAGNYFFVGGAFDTIGGEIRNGIVQVTSLGKVATFFVPALEGGPVHAIAVRPNGKVLKGGEFLSSNGKRRGISQLNVDGTLDQTFDPGLGVNGAVNVLTLAGDGKVVIAGEFTQVNGVTQSNIARLQSDGKLDTTFRAGLGANMKIRAMITQSDEKIIVGGDFRYFDGQPRAGLARLHPDGSLDESFRIGMIGFGAVMCLANQADGGVLIGGSFSSLDVNGRPYLARLLPTDTDGDGMPDVWEKAHGLDFTRRDDFFDQDNDGSTNLQEYLAGTNPNDPNSSTNIRFGTAPGALEFRISTVEGHRYQLQEANSPENPIWHAIGEARSGNGQDAIFAIPLSQVQVSIFRIAILDE